MTWVVLRTCTTSSQVAARTRWSRTCKASHFQAFPGVPLPPGRIPFIENSLISCSRLRFMIFTNIPPSRVPLSTLSISSDNVAAANSTSTSNSTSRNVDAFALKLPGSRHHSEPVIGNSPSPRSSRKQNLGWKKPRMRKSWSE